MRVTALCLSLVGTCLLFISPSASAAGYSDAEAKLRLVGRWFLIDPILPEEPRRLSTRMDVVFLADGTCVFHGVRRSPVGKTWHTRGTWSVHSGILSFTWDRPISLANGRINRLDNRRVEIEHPDLGLITVLYRSHKDAEVQLH